MHCTPTEKKEHKNVTYPITCMHVNDRMLINIFHNYEMCERIVMQYIRAISYDLYLAASTKAVLITFNGSIILALTVSTYSPNYRTEREGQQKESVNDGAV